MSKKYSNELKLKIVQEYLGGTLGFTLLAQKYNISSRSLIQKWVGQYKIYGKKGLKRKKTKKKYPLSFKRNVLQFKQDTGASYKDTANAFGISEPSIIANWKRAYLKEGEPGLSKSIGRPPMMSQSDKDKKNQHKKKKKEQDLSEIDRLKKENEYLRIELGYLKKLKERGFKDPRDDNKQK